VKRRLPQVAAQDSELFRVQDTAIRFTGQELREGEKIAARKNSTLEELRTESQSELAGGVFQHRDETNPTVSRRRLNFALRLGLFS
jgi:hypothetical protein